MALEQDHIPDAEPSQVEGRARPVGASSDDNDVSGGHSGGPMVAEPGTGRNPAGSHIFPEIFPETITVPETGARFRASTQHVYGIHPTRLASKRRATARPPGQAPPTHRDNQGDNRI